MSYVNAGPLKLLVASTHVHLHDVHTSSRDNDKLREAIVSDITIPDVLNGVSKTSVPDKSELRSSICINALHTMQSNGTLSLPCDL